MASLGSSTALRLAGYYSVAFAAVIVVLGAILYVAIRSELARELDGRIVTERAAVLRDARTAGLASVIAARARYGSGDMRYALIDAARRPIAGSPVDGLPPRMGWTRLAVIEPDGHRDATRAFVSAAAGGTLVVGADPEALEELDERMLPLLAVAFGLVAAIGAGGAALLGRALSRRLGALHRTAEAIIGGDLARRMPVGAAGDEFDRLSATLNRMLDRMGELLANLKQVSGDIAHDLRTPLSRLRQKLELGLTGDPAPAAMRTAMQEALDRSDDALALLGGMLAVAEVEAGGLRLRPFDLSALLTDLAESYAPAAEDDGRTLTAAVAPGIEVTGNRELLAQAVGNLLDNALRHTPAGTPIALSLTATATQAVLMVADSGDGIAPIDRERVLHRFVRLERSRSTPGHGLGLSLVAAAARAHGGGVCIEDNQPGTRMIVTISRNGR